jgi:hypothetical protein
MTRQMPRRPETTPQLLPLASTARMLCETLALAAPDTVPRTEFMRRVVEHAVTRMQLPDAVLLDTAARLAQFGLISAQTRRETRIDVNRCAELGYQLLSMLPYFEVIAAMIRWQGQPPPPDLPRTVRRGAALLRAGWLLDHAVVSGQTRRNAADILAAARPTLPEEVVHEFASFALGTTDVKIVTAAELQVGDLLDEDVRSGSGVLLLSREHRLTAATLQHLIQFAQQGGIREPLRIRTNLD